MRIKKLAACAITLCTLVSAVPTMGLKEVRAAETTSSTYYENGYALTIVQTVGKEVPSSVIEKMKYIYFNQYPKMSKRLNPSRPRAVTFKYDPDYDGVAYTLGTTIVFSVDYMNSHQKDVDCATHELAHVVQGGYRNYGSSLIATSLCEGVADYMRSVYGLYNGESGWGMSEYRSGQSYTDSYGVTANFLTWVSLNKDSRIIYYLNKTMHDGTYTDNLWVELTGETVDQLWDDYVANPGVYTMSFSSNKEESFGITSGDTYVIENVASGKALSVENDASDNGANVCQRTYTENNQAQQWTITYAGNGLYTINNKANGKALDVNMAGSGNGTNIQLYENNYGNAQKWAIVERGGNYTLFPVCGNGKGVMDLSSSSPYDGANIQLYEWNKTDAQRWNIQNINRTDNEDFTPYAFERIEAESFVTCSPDIGVAIDENSTRSGGGNIGGLQGVGTWTMYHGVVFEENAVGLELMYCNPGADSYVNVYVDSMNNAPVGKIITPHNSSDWSNYTTLSGNFNTMIPAGTHDIYLEFQNDGRNGYAQNCDWFTFIAQESIDGFSVIEAENCTEKSSNIVFDPNSSRSNGYNIGGVTNNSYIEFDNVKFTEVPKSFSVCYSTPNGWAFGQMEIYVDDMNSTPVGICQATVTGNDWSAYAVKQINLTGNVSTGVHKIYIKFTNGGAAAYVANVDYFQFGKNTVNNIEVSDRVNVLGFQISQMNWGLRSVFSVESVINNKQVVEYGAIYALKDYVSSTDEIFVGSTNAYVKSFKATSAAIMPERVSDSATATDYAITMVNNGNTAAAFQAGYYVRAYAKLSDGSYVYSNVSDYTIFSIAKKLYDGVKMPNYNAHKGLYNNIIKIVDPSYQEVAFDFSKIFVKF